MTDASSSLVPLYGGPLCETTRSIMGLLSHVGQVVGGVPPAPA